MRNRTLQYVILRICISFVVFYTILFFLFQYDYIAPHQKIDFILDWLDLNLDMSFVLTVAIISLITNIVLGGVVAIIEWNSRRKIGHTIFKFDMKMDKWEWGVVVLFMVLLAFSGGVFFIIFLRNPLDYIILYLLSMAVTIYLFAQFLLFKENGITENGIKYEHSYFLWEDILYYSWQEEKNLALELTIQSKVLFWKYTYPINIKVPRSSQKEIERLLEG